ncbi:hypothetical protein [Frankia sp. CiP3]|nr:hypothetical protein [Frankia sp. CiP3]
MDAFTSDAMATAEVGELDLDVSIVEQGDAVNALLCTTDNGCSTNKQKDC